MDLQTKLGVLFIATIVAFLAGWNINGWRYDAKVAKALQTQIKQVALQNTKERILTSTIQTKQTITDNHRIQLNAKIKDLPDNRVCFANWDAVQLWNSALTGPVDVSKNTSGAIKETEGTSITTTDILENINENAARWKDLRDQVDAIIEWDHQTFGIRN